MTILIYTVWNSHAGVFLKEGVTNQFHVQEGQEWRDCIVPCAPGGWDTDNPDVRLGNRISR